MASLIIGPLLRHVDRDSATVWVETDSRCSVRVVRSDDPSTDLGVADTFHVSGHHYALVPILDLEPDTTTAYDVLLDDRPVWPEPDSGQPPSRIRTAGGDGAFVVAFGSCRYATPNVVDREPEATVFPPDALDTYAAQLMGQPEDGWPDALVLLGDQVYADEVATETREYLASRRDLSVAPGDQLANFEEFTYIYRQSWRDPEIRWLLSTIPSSMIFDDHDVIDDWNTSAAWRTTVTATDWWDDRIAGALGSYWVYQHIGNLSPEELAADPNWKTVTAAEDGGSALREIALAADREPAGVRWSYKRTWHTARLLMVDSRAGRVLGEDERSMLDDEEFEWVEQRLAEAAHDGVRHVLIGTSLPWLMPHALHNLEGWVSELATTHDGRPIGRLAEKIRQGADLEHWSAFRNSFDRLGRAIVGLARGDSGPAPASVLVLSGDVHHAYVAEVVNPPDLSSPVFQLTCSPVHNAVPHPMAQTFKMGWGKPATLLSAGLRRLAGVRRPTIRWQKKAGPYFGNELAILTLDGDEAWVRFCSAEDAGDGSARLRTVLDQQLA